MKNIIFIAPPAAGKGTQAKLVSAEYNIPHISTGDLLREEINMGTIIGQEIQKCMERGDLVSNDIINSLLKKRLVKEDCLNGYILDGYPRNIEQAKLYDNLINELGMSNPFVIYFNVSREVALSRMLSRVICQNCGSSFNLLVDELKPKVENICDRCGHELMTRSDDKVDTFNHRFDTYINSTQELINYYQDKGLLYEVSVDEKSADSIFKEVKEILKND